MAVFVDTSGLIALLDSDDTAHAAVRGAWRQAVMTGEGLITTDYVVVESVAVAQQRWGLEAVRTLTDQFVPLIEVESVPAEVLMSAIGVLLTAGRRRLSLVDCVSFIRMRAVNARDYLGADAHFDEQGFRRYAPAD